MIRKLMIVAMLVTICGIRIEAAEFMIFSDVKFMDSTSSEDNNQFILGALDFYATAAIDDNTRVFIEYVFENTGHGLITDLERLWIAREFADIDFTLSAGRFHTPLGYWNRTYHHGTYIQDTVSRPFFLEFEDAEAGILPVHIVGLMMWGGFHYFWGSLDYELFIANGPSINTDEYGFSASSEGKPEIDINAEGDANDDKSYGLRITANRENLDASLFFFNGKIAESGTGTNSLIDNGNELIEQLIYGGDLKLEKGKFDLLAEFYQFDNESNILSGGGSYSGSAYYSQFGWQFMPDLKAILRYEKLDYESGDHYFQLLGASEEERELAALRYDLSESHALTFEFSHHSPEKHDSKNVFLLQWSFIVL